MARTSEDVDKLSAALVKARSKLRNPTKSATADAGKYSYGYAPLDSILAEASPILAEEGLAVLQEALSEDGSVGIVTRIIHESGQWMEFGPLWLPAGNSPQDYGGATTYGRRYSLTAALGIAAEEDTDAQHVVGSGRGSRARGSRGKGSQGGDASGAPEEETERPAPTEGMSQNAARRAVLKAVGKPPEVEQLWLERTGEKKKFNDLTAEELVSLLPGEGGPEAVTGASAEEEAVAPTPATPEGATEPETQEPPAEATSETEKPSEPVPGPTVEENPGGPATPSQWEALAVKYNGEEAAAKAVVWAFNLADPSTLSSDQAMSLLGKGGS